MSVRGGRVLQRGKKKEKTTWYTLKRWRPDTHAQTQTNLTVWYLAGEGLIHMHAQLEQV